MYPTAEDYAFFYSVLQDYAEHYGKDTPLYRLPAITLIENKTIAEAMEMIRKQVVFKGWVLFKMPVLYGYVTLNGHVLSVDDEESWLTLGYIKDEPTSTLADGTNVYCAQIGEDKTWDVAAGEILQFGNNVKKFLSNLPTWQQEDVWNLAFYNKHDDWK